MVCRIVMSATRIIVSKPGVDALSATDAQMLFDSNANLSRIIAQGTITQGVGVNSVSVPIVGSGSVVLAPLATISGGGDIVGAGYDYYADNDELIFKYRGSGNPSSKTYRYSVRNTEVL